KRRMRLVLLRRSTLSNLPNLDFAVLLVVLQVDPVAAGNDRLAVTNNTHHGCLVRPAFSSELLPRERPDCDVAGAIAGGDGIIVFRERHGDQRVRWSPPGPQRGAVGDAGESQGPVITTGKQSPPVGKECNAADHVLMRVNDADQAAVGNVP